MFFQKTRRPKDLTEGVELRVHDVTVPSIMDGAKLARENGLTVAKFSQVTMDKRFSSELKAATLISNPEDKAMPKTPGWYIIDRKTMTYKPTTRNIIYNPNFSWDEKILILSPATEAKRQTRMISLYRDYESYSAAYLVADTCIRRGNGAKLALAEKANYAVMEKQQELVPLRL